jgi:RNA polymerase sigma-70 factor (ECF subfamily)
MTDALRSIPANSLSTEGEADLISRIKAGDQAACTKLVALFTPRMMAVARRFLCCDDDCNDALQDAYISAFRALSGFEGGARLSTWLHRITVNCCLMRLRTGSSRNETPIGDLPPGFHDYAQRTHRFTGEDPSAEVEMDEARQIVRRAIERLPESYREVLLLRDIEQIDTTDTAARLKITAHNVKRRLHHARQSLCALLEPMMTGEEVLAT